MKRIVTFLITLSILFLAFQFVVTLFVKKHTLTYQVSSGDKTFQITEDYQKEQQGSEYYFQVKEGEHILTFSASDQFNKQKEIIKQIEYYESGDLLCIFPVLKKGKTGELICQKGTSLFTYSALKGMQNSDVDLFVQQLKNKNYQSMLWEVMASPMSLNDVTYYPGYFLEDYYLSVWNYRGVDLFSTRQVKRMQVLEQDHYENGQGIRVGNYYLVLNHDQKYEFNQIFVIDILKGTKDFLFLNDSLSFDGYFNGVVDSKAYYTDRNSKVQYAIDPKKKSAQVVGNQELNGQYYNGKWQTQNIYDFVSKDLYFEVAEEIPQDLVKYRPITFLKEDAYYYFETNTHQVYRVQQDHLDQAVLLFQDQNMRDMKVVGQVVYFLSGNTIYQYEMTSGLKPLIVKEEFRFNAQNIYDVVKK